MIKTQFIYFLFLPICMSIACSGNTGLEGRWVLEKKIAIGNGKEINITPKCAKESYLGFTKDSITIVEYSERNYSNQCSKKMISSKYKFQNGILSFNSRNNERLVMKLTEFKEGKSFVLKSEGQITILSHYKMAPALPKKDYSLVGKWVHERKNGVTVTITFGSDDKVTYLVKRGNADITEEVFGTKKDYLKLSYELNNNSDPKELDFIVHNTKNKTTKRRLGIMRFLAEDTIELKIDLFESRPTYFDETDPELFTRVN